jgi:DNA-binding GntR family transcriptional regulator
MVIDSSPVLPETIYLALRAGILDQSEAPGTTVTESAVSLRFGVARPTARLAIERLVREGLLRREAHRAARVPELGRDDIIDLFDTRAVVEAAALAALARSGTIPAEALAAHRALLGHADDDRPFADEDIAFHRSLVQGQPSARLAMLHEQLLGEIELCIGQVDAQRLLGAREIAAQHQGILDAVVAGDSALAAERTRTHIHGARDKLLARYDADHR